MGTPALESLGIRSFNSRRAWAGLAGSAGAIMLLGLAMIWGMQRYLHALDVMAATAPDAAIARAGLSLRILALVMGGLAIGTAWHTARSCTRVVRAQQLPPPGAWVLGKPTVMFGARAVAWGRIGYVLASVLAVMGAAFAYLMWQFVDLMMSGVGSAQI